jgi:hypothetical protein
MDFTMKARLVAQGDLTDLNGLDLLMFDVGNAYLNTMTMEKLYCDTGKEFGPDEVGRLMIIQRALYRLKSSGAAYDAHLATH